MALVVAAQPATPPPAPAPLDEEAITVTGARLAQLKRLNMVTRRDHRTGALMCVFKRRSGDPRLDALICEAALACAPTATTVDQMRACMAPTMDPLTRGIRWVAEGQR